MVLRRTIYALADSPAFTGWISDKGMKWGFARRFIAGETLEETLPTVESLRRHGLLVTLDYLGESVHDEAETYAVVDTYRRMLDDIDRRTRAEDSPEPRITPLGGALTSISLKPTQLGLAIDAELARRNIAQIVDHARELDNFVRIDMEDSPTTQATIEMFKALRAEYDNVGVVVQSYLHRTEEDVRALNAIDAKLRLCKGAYKEPATVAFQDKADVDRNYLRCAEMLLQEGTYPAFATHDHRIIGHIIEYADKHGIGKDRYEFQMLYGVRRDYQLEIARDGFNVRIYVPFGKQWCPYFMRRIAERPANAWFVARAMLGG
jgi:proline dehydrogenase